MKRYIARERIGLLLLLLILLALLGGSIWYASSHQNVMSKRHVPEAEVLVNDSSFTRGSSKGNGVHSKATDKSKKRNKAKGKNARSRKNKPDNRNTSSGGMRDILNEKIECKEKSD